MLAMSSTTVFTPFFMLPYVGSGVTPTGDPTTLNRKTLAAAAAAAEAADAAADPVKILLLPVLALLLLS